MKVRNTVDAEGLALRKRPAAAPSDRDGDHSGQDGSRLYNFLLVEDQTLYAEGFHRVLQRIFPGAQLRVGENGEQGLSLMASQQFDLVFLDVQLPDISGLQLLPMLLQRNIRQPVVILTGAVDPQTLEQAQRGGALGIFSRRLNDGTILRHCRRMLDGEALFEPSAPVNVAVPEGIERLTGREQEVLFKLAEGLENAEICQVLGMSDSTLRTHLRSLFQKLQVRNRTACVVKAIRIGLI